MCSYRAFLALSDMDPQCMGYIEAYANAQRTSVTAAPAGKPLSPEAPSEQSDPVKAADTAVKGERAPAGSAASAGSGTVIPGKETASAMSLGASIERGIAKSASAAVRAMLADGRPGLEIIDSELIPALDRVGKGFEKGTIFLPQLLMSAEAAKAAFEVIRETLQDGKQEMKGRIILATVKGDIHDIGKNIVKVMLENYGYDILDLGKDVAPETIVETAQKEKISLVGLSALMTTTVVSMEETIRQLRKKKPDTKVVVGGAVMTQEYADAIGADCYAPDAMATVHYAEKVFGKGG